MLRFVIVLGAGYVLGAKAGRRRYDQLADTYRTVAGSPAAKAVIDAGRRRIADRVSPDPALVEVENVDESTTVLAPRQGRLPRKG